jgi:hypothetical protein
MKTAEEILNKWDSKELYEDKVFTEDIVIRAMVSFAKLHVEEALLQASNKAELAWEVDMPLNGDLRKSYYVNPKSITGAYSLENIK